jgi:hypothetical protein
MSLECHVYESLPLCFIGISKATKTHSLVQWQHTANVQLANKKKQKILMATLFPRIFAAKTNEKNGFWLSLAVWRCCQEYFNMYPRIKVVGVDHFYSHGWSSNRVGFLEVVTSNCVILGPNAVERFERNEV